MFFEQGGRCEREEASRHAAASYQGNGSPNDLHWAKRSVPVARKLGPVSPINERFVVYLSRVRVRGLRGAADGPLELALPGRFTVIAGANGGGKTTLMDAIYLSHSSTRRRLRPRGPVNTTLASCSLSTVTRRWSLN